MIFKKKFFLEKSGMEVHTCNVICIVSNLYYGVCQMLGVIFVFYVMEFNIKEIMTLN